MSKEELEKLLIDAMHEAISFGRELENTKDKVSISPAAIHTAVKWRVNDILNPDE